jgi:hypothetical protein
MVAGVEWMSKHRRRLVHCSDGFQMLETSDSLVKIQGYFDYLEDQWV